MSLPPKQLERVKAERREDLLRTAVPILQGLLASGHFTQPESESGVIYRDHGEDWKEDCRRARYVASAIDEAMELACDLIQEIEWNVHQYDDDHPSNVERTAEP